MRQMFRFCCVGRWKATIILLHEVRLIILSITTNELYPPEMVNNQIATFAKVFASAFINR